MDKEKVGSNISIDLNCIFPVGAFDLRPVLDVRYC